MKYGRSSLFCLLLLMAGLFLAPSNVSAQNKISGFVFGYQRQPISDVYVELLDDFRRTVGRTRTNGSGFYSFSGMSDGRFTVYVLTLGTEYEEQEVSVTIENIVSASGSSNRLNSNANEQKDVYLKLRRGVEPAAVAVFVQPEVPKDALKLYEKAISDLENKRETEGQAGLRAAIELFPRYFAALERLAMEYLKMKKPEYIQASAVLFSLAKDVNPRATKSWYGLGYAQYLLGNNAEGLVAAEKALELNGGWPEALCLAGILQRRAKKFPEAEKNLSKAVELSKDSMAVAHRELAFLYGDDLNRYADAVKQLKLFLKTQTNPKDIENIQKLIADYEAKALKS